VIFWIGDTGFAEHLSDGGDLFFVERIASLDRTAI